MNMFAFNGEEGLLHLYYSTQLYLGWDEGTELSEDTPKSQQDAYI